MIFSFFHSLVLRFVIPAVVPPADVNFVVVNLADTNVFLPLSAVDFGALFASVSSKADAPASSGDSCERSVHGLAATGQIQNRHRRHVAFWQ